MQVKRRTKSDPVESVRVVREMLGVMLRDQSRKSMIVSSANKFSYFAKNEAKEVQEKLLVDYIDLIDVNSLHSIMKNYFNPVAIDP